jgi:hypothetical protein
MIINDPRRGVYHAMKRPDQPLDYYHFPIGYWLLFVTALVLAFIAAICSILFVLEQNNERCFVGQGIGTLPVPTLNGGLDVGKIKFLSNQVEVRIIWWVNTSYGAPTRISFRGPLDAAGVGVLPIAPYALTICGGNTTESCDEMEARTCSNYHKPVGCGKLEALLKYLDAEDTELHSNFFNITGFLRDAKANPELFYISLEAAGVGEIQRGAIGGTCSADLL